VRRASGFRVQQDARGSSHGHGQGDANGDTDAGADGHDSTHGHAAAANAYAGPHKLTNSAAPYGYAGADGNAGGDHL
jgi:hypothetical protein